MSFKCTVCNEIKDWFAKLVTETCGPSINIRGLSNAGHFDIHTTIEISGNEVQINKAIELIERQIEIVGYKMPWLNGNPYYVRNENQMANAENQLKCIKNANYDVYYNCSFYQMAGIVLIVYNFRPDLDDSIRLEIDRTFQSLAHRTPFFITYPRGIRRAPPQKSSDHMATYILTAFHGKFLKYLGMEDILSLELANKCHGLDHDAHLDHDIQKYLFERYPLLYDGKKHDYYDLQSFKTYDVLCYFIHKYHDRFIKIEVPNILTADEIQTLSRTYNLQIEHLNIIHVDFRSTNKLDGVDFCAIYHSAPNDTGFLNYNPKFATQNHLMYFNADDTLDSLTWSKEFQYFVIKSKNNCSPQKTNRILRYVTEHFHVNVQHLPELILYKFDLISVSNQILSSLLYMMRRGMLQFHKITFNLQTLLTILVEQCDQEYLLFKRCNISMEGCLGVRKKSKIAGLWFIDMDIELQLLSILRNIECLEFRNCHIISTKYEIPSDMEVSHVISFTHTNFSIPTLQQLLEMLKFTECPRFLSCYITNIENDAEKMFTIRNKIAFVSMIFAIETLIQIFANCVCELQSRIIFDSCHFHFENNETNKCFLGTMNVAFYNIKFDSPTLLKILEAFNNETKILIANSCIIQIDSTNSIKILNKIIQLDYLEFNNCEIGMEILFNIFGKLSENTKVVIKNCNLLYSCQVYDNILPIVSEIQFFDMKLSSRDLFDILTVLKESAWAKFTKCEIIVDDSGKSPKLQNKINITFYDMTIESQIAWPLLQTDARLYFDKCCLNFLIDTFSNKTIKSYIEFRNMAFDLSTHLKSLAHCTPESVIEFKNCHFVITKHFLIPNILIQPLTITLRNLTIDLEVLMILMERISENTKFKFVNCKIVSSTHIVSIRPMKIPIVSFRNMSMDIKTIFCILAKFADLQGLYFHNCRLCCTSPKDSIYIKLKLSKVYFQNMEMDVQIFLAFVDKCATTVTVHIDNCKFISVASTALSKVSLEIKRLMLSNVNYSPELLLILQCLNRQCIVLYYDQMSDRALIEICTKSPIFGKQLVLWTQIYTKSFCVELFAEFFRSKALNFKFDEIVEYVDPPTHLIPLFRSVSYDNQLSLVEWFQPIETDIETDTDTEYDPLTHFIPDISSLSDNIQYDWNAFKIKFVAVNDVSVKLDFLKDGKSIDLFYELNNLPDDSNEWVVDYY